MVTAQRALYAIVFGLFLTHAIAAEVANRIRVATYNLQNYNTTDRIAHGVYRRDYPKPEIEKDALRAIIRSTSPDVLAVQEIGSVPFVRELQRDLQREGMVYPHIAHMRGSDSERMLAVFSRIPFSAVTRHDDLEFAYRDGRTVVKRGLLEVRFETEGVPWTLFTLHLKGKFTDFPDDPLSESRRIREAHAVRERILTVFPENTEARYLIVGDFNDSRDTPAVQRFLKIGQRDLCVIVEAHDARGDTWTHHWKRQDLYSRIDFILASKGFIPHLVPDSGSIADMPYWRDASDHRMVYVDLVFPEPSPED